jgi:hypothetical protein
MPPFGGWRHPPRKQLSLNQPQAIHAGVPVLADDDVIVHGDAERHQIIFQRGRSAAEEPLGTPEADFLRCERECVLCPIPGCVLIKSAAASRPPNVCFSQQRRVSGHRGTSPSGPEGEIMDRWK